MQMTDRLLALRAFVRTARSGSLSRAARDLGLSQPSISRILAQLEAEVGARLLVRTTRAVTLTEAGADYLARVEPLLTALEEADHLVRGTGELRGVLRVAVSSSFGVREVIPRLPKFLGRHPALRIDLGISDQRQDLVVDGVDVALRLGSLPDSSVVARKLAEAPRVLAASPSYLKRRGHPQTPGDLAFHLAIIGPGTSGQNGWTFRRNGQSQSIRVEGQLVTAVNEGAVAGAVAGLGITLTSLWGCRAEIERGDLIRIMEDWAMEPVEVHALFPSGRAASPAARAFIDYLAREL